MEFLRQEHWSGLPFPSPGDPPDPGVDSTSPALAAGFLTAEPLGKPTPALGQALTSQCISPGILL